MPFPTTRRRFLVHHLHVPRLVAELVVCVFNQVREVIDDLWGKRNTSINLGAPRHHCATRPTLLEAPKWKPAASPCLPDRQTSAPQALKRSKSWEMLPKRLPLQIRCTPLLEERGENYSPKQQDQSR